MPYKMLYLARRAQTVAWADWPRTWRSHAIFASQFPAMSGTIDWMRYCTRIDDPAYAHLPVSTAHDGVSVAEAPKLETFLGLGFSPEQRALIDQDELRVFDRYTPDFSFYCTEFPIIPGPPSEIAVFRFLARRPDLPRPAFDDQLKNEYAPLAAAAGANLAIKRAALNFTLDTPPPDFPFDAIEESWFATLDEAAAALTAPQTQELAATLAKTCDLTRNITMLTRPTHRWPKPSAA